MSLWSLSVPDEAVEQTLGQGSDTLIQFSKVHVKLSNLQGGKYTVIEGEDTWITHSIRLSEVFAVRPKTGVEFWTRVHQRLQDMCNRKLQTDLEKDTSKRNQMPEAWIPTFRWEGDDFILQANKGVYDGRSHGLPFAISLKIAQAFGFVKQDPVTQKWSLGPNVVPSYPVYDSFPLATADFTAYKPEGPTLFLPPPRLKDGRHHPTMEWIKVYNNDPKDPFDRLMLSNALEWRMIHLNRSFARLTNQLETVMVYTDAVQSNAVNHLQVPLLRSLHLHRSGRGRVTVEPLHREWVALNGNTLELLEFQCATPSGPLTDLSPGQTILTVGLKPIKT